ncbi:MAG: hypothetical protein NWE99_04225 [Candidatus Bathyarchaeota archaeon]|nr:hypothetical protein [Candidatus Bathyarchaeota archaeon]
MNSQTNNSLKIGAVIIVTLIAIAFLAALWASYTLPSSQFQERPRPTQFIRGDFEFFYVAQTVLSTVNVVLLVFLLTIYVDVYRKTRSQFTIGLIIFSAVFLVRAIAANPLVMRAFGFIAFGLGPFALLPDLFEFVALAVLLYLSIKY